MEIYGQRLVRPMTAHGSMFIQNKFIRRNSKFLSLIFQGAEKTTSKMILIIAINSNCFVLAKFICRQKSFNEEEENDKSIETLPIRGSY